MDGYTFKKEPLENTYEIGDDIGSGHFALVRRVVHKKSGQAFAAKFIRKRRGGGRKGAKAEDIHREVSILRQLNHDNIISLYDVFETGIEVILILELVTGGELFDYISERDHLGEEEASAFIAQILRGVKHLHDHNIAHLDLKPENIMLCDRNSQNIKLIDFGLAQRIQGNQDIRALMGTAEFVAPEVVSYETLSLATDMWSVGVITYILLSGASPFLGDNQQETYHNITAINFQFDEEYFANTSELAQDFITKLFIRIPKKRATVDDCLNHPWIRPKEPQELIKRQSAVINIDKFKAFMARKRWRQSMRVVSLCNRLSKSVLLRKSSDTLGSRNTLDDEKSKAVSIPDQSASTSNVETLATENTSKCFTNAQVSKNITGHPSTEGSSPNKPHSTNKSKDLASLEENDATCGGGPSAPISKHPTIGLRTAGGFSLNNNVIVDETPAPSTASSSPSLQAIGNTTAEDISSNAVSTTLLNCKSSFQQSHASDAQSSDVITKTNHESAKNLAKIESEAAKQIVAEEFCGQKSLDDAVEHDSKKSDTQSDNSLINNSSEQSGATKEASEFKETLSKCPKSSTHDNSPLQEFTKSANDAKDVHDSMSDNSSSLRVDLSSEKLEDLSKGSHFSDVLRPPQQPIIPC